MQTEVKSETNQGNRYSWCEPEQELGDLPLDHKSLTVPTELH